jgi:two-component system LytT family response regulator
MKLKCIAIDDEPLTLSLIESYINKIPYLNCEGCFTSAIKALEIIKENKIDLILIDINMPDISGLDFIKSLTKHPKFIFITAYEQFAIDGFDLQASDYLLKPVSFTRFIKATDRVYESLKEKLSEAEYLFVKAEHQILKVNYSDINYIEGYKDYVKIHTSAIKPILTLLSLKSLEEILPINRFIRIHKSYIISLDKINSIKNNKIQIGEKYLPIGENYKYLIQDIINIE